MSHYAGEYGTCTGQIFRLMGCMVGWLIGWLVGGQLLVGWLVCSLVEEVHEQASLALGWIEE